MTSAVLGRRSIVESALDGRSHIVHRDPDAGRVTAEREWSFVERRDRRQGVAPHVHAAHRQELEYVREVQPVAGPVVDETENAKNAEPDPSAGPAPNRHLLGFRTRPAIPPEGSAPTT